MAGHMIDIFGEMLHRDQRDEERGVLPSPEEMKYKILIKVYLKSNSIVMTFIPPSPPPLSLSFKGQEAAPRAGG